MLQAATVRRSMDAVKIWRRQETESSERRDRATRFWTKDSGNETDRRVTLGGQANGGGLNNGRWVADLDLWPSGALLASWTYLGT